MAGRLGESGAFYLTVKSQVFTSIEESRDTDTSAAMMLHPHFQAVHCQ